MHEELESQGPDCRSCWRRGECERAREGTFCTSWAASKPKEPEHPDAWERGDGPNGDTIW